MEKHRDPSPSVIARPRWCTLVDPAAGGPLKLCLGLVDCSRCGFAQWLEQMDADLPAQPVAYNAAIPVHRAAAA